MNPSDIGAVTFRIAVFAMRSVRLQAGSYGIGSHQRLAWLQSSNCNSVSGLLKNDYGGAVAHWLAVEFAAFSSRVFAEAIDTDTVAAFAEFFKLFAHLFQIGFGHAGHLENRILHSSSPAEQTARDLVALAVVFDVVTDPVRPHLISSAALPQRAVLDPESN
ncbi:MAG: hypothetical protein WD397_11740 [Wenzhouxiangellaceae bacterium]